MAFRQLIWSNSLKSLLINCPGCMRRVEIAASANASASCPFCGEVVERTSSEATLDRPLRLMHRSRSTALAALLGATLTLGACSKKNGPDPDATLYGAPPIDEPETTPGPKNTETSPATQADMSAPAPDQGTPSADTAEEKPEDAPAAKEEEAP